MISDGLKLVFASAAALAVGVLAYEAGKSGPSSSSASSQTLTAGQRYRITLTTTPANPFGVQPSALALNQKLNGAYPGVFSVATLETTTPTTLTFLVDVLKTTPAPSFNLDGTPPTSVTFAPLGATPAAASAWTRVTAAINPGDRVRGSIPAATFSTIATSLGVAPTLAGFQQFLANPNVAAQLSTTSIAAWGPGPTPALPLDWPTDDPSPATEYHYQFTYGGTVPIPIGSLPMPGQIWHLPAV